MTERKTILVVAPHADDETLGMGATIAKRTAGGDRVVVAIMTGPGEEPHPLWPRSVWETVRSEAREAVALLGAELVFGNLPAACLTDIPGHQINREMESVVRDVEPDEVYLPFYHDLHRDHTLLTYAALVSCRPYLHRARRIAIVAMYETLTETHLMPAAIAQPFQPNHWVDVSDTIDRKIAAWGCYKSQHQAGNAPRTADTLRALAKFRGAHIEAAAAEAFMIVQSIC